MEEAAARSIGLVAALALVACGGRLAEEADASAANDASVIETSIDAPATNTCKLSTANLVAYYPLDSDTSDHSGHGNDATGMHVTQALGVVSGALHFDGATSTLHVTSGKATLSGPRTLCAWVRPNATTGAGQPIFWAGQTGQGDFFALFSATPSSTTCKVTSASAPYVDHWGSECIEPLAVPVTSKEWSLVCYAFDGGAVEASIDGKEGKAPGTLYDYALTTLFIGSTLGSGTTTKAAFDGDIDEVSVWSVRLQNPDLAALWNGGAGCPL